MRIRTALAVLAGLMLLGVGAASAMPTDPVWKPPGASYSQPRTPPLTHRMRVATARFHDITTALSAGYVPFKDTAGVSCIDEPGMGGMGVHFVNPRLIANPAIHPTAPEALVYAPERDGTLRLAALEFLVDASAWEAHHTYAPALFAHHRFDVTPAPNRFGLPRFYSQHVWVWRANPAGELAMWNPRVHCPRP